MKRIFTICAVFFTCLCARSQAWIELGTGPDALNANFTINALMTDPAGHIYAAGGFTDSPTYISGYSYVAMWNDSMWVTLGTGDSALNANNSIYAMNMDQAGNIYAAGNFTDSNGRQYVAKWNGVNWTELGEDTAGLNAVAPIYAVTTDAAGNVYAAGAFTDLVFAYNHYYVAMWNGHWSEVGLDSVFQGGIGADSIIYALATDSHGNLYAAGAFTDSNGYSYVAKWNGTTWTHLENDSNKLNANGQINALILDTAGNVYVAGEFTDSLGYFEIMKWNGDSAWVELSNPANNQINLNGPINALALDSVGNVYAGGRLADSSGNFYYIAVWNGAAILTADNSGSSPLMANDAVLAMTSDIYGNIYAAGNFTDANAFKYVAEFTGNIPSGIKAIHTDHLQIYPNPTTGITYIQAEGLTGNSDVQVIDGIGRMIYHEHLVGTTISTQIDASAYSTGVYTLLIRDSSGKVVTQRIVKE